MAAPAPTNTEGSHSTSKQRAAYLTQQLCTLGALTFGIPIPHTQSTLSHRYSPVTREKLETEKELYSLLRDPSIGAAKAQKCFASAMDTLLTEYIRARYGTVPRGVEVGGPSTAELRKWVKVVLAPFVRRVLGVVLSGGEAVGEAETRDKGAEIFGEEEVKEWQVMALERLGRLRVSQFFDIVVGWPGTEGMVLDVKKYATTPAARLHLTRSFIQQTKGRLLHYGASTPHILDIYISVIQAFKLLDPKGVLLHRVAEPIKKYLQGRDDVSKVLIASYLADLDKVDDDGNLLQLPDDVCERAAMMLQREDADGEAREEVNFTIDWVPDPIDAVPGYKESRYGDVTSYLLNLFDTDQGFVRELQNILAEHLLKNNDTEFVKERMLVQKLSLRFGKTALQACEVMLHDLSLSVNVNKKIRKDSGLEDTPLYERQILSRMYWPPLRAESFKLPLEIQNLSERYVGSFERTNHMRILEDVPALGNVNVELELEDRFVVEENVYPWQATVIYTFRDLDQAMPGLPVTRTVKDLEHELDMSEALVRNALLFWVGKGVLRESSTDAYTVIENRTADADSSEVAALAAAAAEAAEASVAAASLMKSAEEVKMENMQMCEKGVIAMLTNQGAMQLSRIGTMLRLLVPEGGTYAEAELRDLLQRLVDNGRLERSGVDTYRIAPGQVSM